jgi:hypothetical protein
MFKAKARAAAALRVSSIDPVESFRSGLMAGRSVAADLLPA